jgi:hypothetical protein
VEQNQHQKLKEPKDKVEINSMAKGDSREKRYQNFEEKQNNKTSKELPFGTSLTNVLSTTVGYEPKANEKNGLKAQENKVSDNLTQVVKKDDGSKKRKLFNFSGSGKRTIMRGKSAFK